MPADDAVTRPSKAKWFACRLAMGLTVALVPAQALAQDSAAAPMAPPATMQEPPARPPTGADTSGKGIGGHVGIATPLYTHDKTHSHSISDSFDMLNPIGISVKINANLVVDFEMVVVTHFQSHGAGGGLIIDPGVVYNFGAVAAGVRAAFKVGDPPNFGLIPLINKGIVDLGGATWFIEAAFPTFYSNLGGTEFNVVLHTGLGF
jgi:hypothetical protein